MTSSIQSSILKFANLIAPQIAPIDSITMAQENKQWRVTLRTPNELAFVEDDCTVLKAIQHVIRVLIHKQFPESKSHFIFDVNEYSQKREHIISIKIPELAQVQVIKNGKTIILVNLSAYERLQVHSILNEVKNLETTSVGSKDNRKLLIMPSSDVGASNFEDAIIFDIDNHNNM